MKMNRVLIIDGNAYVPARCSFCEDTLAALKEDVDQHTHDGKWLCSVCRNIPAEERARVEAIPAELMTLDEAMADPAAFVSGMVETGAVVQANPSADTWYIYGERPNGEWFVVEGPTTEDLAKLKAKELNDRETQDEGEEDAEAEAPIYYWAAKRITDNPPNAYNGDWPPNKAPEKPLSDLTPADVIAMPVAQFEERFGFRPDDKLEKYMFAITASRLNPMLRDAIEAEITGPKPDLSRVAW